MFDTYEQKRYHKKRNLSSWGMHQLEIFYGKKSSQSGLDFAQIAPGEAICLYYDTLDWNA